MSKDFPAYSDGLIGTLSPIVECINFAGVGTTYQRYSYMDDSISVEGVNIDYADADGSPLGGDSRTGFEGGSISLLVEDVTFPLPKPGHVLHCNFGAGDGDEYYRVTNQGRARKRNDMVKISPSVRKIYNPVITTMQSSQYGNRRKFSQAAGALSGVPAAAMATANTRAGGTLAWSLAAAPGSTLPGWVSVNATTGAMSGTVPVGTSEFVIVVTETLAGEVTRKAYSYVVVVGS